MRSCSVKTPKPVWGLCGPEVAGPLREVEIFRAQREGFRQRSVIVGPPFGRRENGLANLAGPLQEGQLWRFAFATRRWGTF
jgi:hypothetical protein